MKTRDSRVWDKTRAFFLYYAVIMWHGRHGEAEPVLGVVEGDEVSDELLVALANAAALPLLVAFYFSLFSCFDIHREAQDADGQRETDDSPNSPSSESDNAILN